MERDKLIERLKGYEWNDIEFKEAQHAVPRNAYETVSAFSNTEGGWLVFGVGDGAGGFEVVGVLEVDKVQNDFLSVLRSGQKLNRVVAAKERLIENDRIGLSEQAGTGIRAIFHNWRQLGHVPPIIDNDKARKAFQLTLLKEELLSEEQLLLQASLGVHLDEAAARAFAFACREGELSPRDVRGVAGLSGVEARTVLERLTVQGLVSPLEGTETPVFVIADHLREQLGRNDRTQPGQQNLSTEQVGPPPTDLVTDQAGPKPPRLVTDQATALQRLDEAAWKIVRSSRQARKRPQNRHDWTLGPSEFP